ncbi:MAG: hypothetical protein U0V73_12715 [Acidimicrobiia bacterium]
MGFEVTFADVHGAPCNGDAAKALLEVADRYEMRLEAAAARG